MGLINNLSLFGFFSDATEKKTPLKSKYSMEKWSSTDKIGPIQVSWIWQCNYYNCLSFKSYQGFHWGFPKVMGFVLVVPWSSSTFFVLQTHLMSLYDMSIFDTPTGIGSVQMVSNSLALHGLQHARVPCPSPTPRACSNSNLSTQWCHPTISSSVISFFSCLPSFPASGPFPMSQFFASSSQSIGASTSTSVLPMNIQEWFPLALTGWISLQSHRHAQFLMNQKQFLCVPK